MIVHFKLLWHGNQPMDQNKPHKVLIKNKFISREGGAISSDILWYLVAMLACLYVVILNGGILFYYDTASYLGWGESLIEHIVDVSRETSTDLAPVTEEPSNTAGSQSPVAAAAAPSFSRSRIYSITLAVFAFVNKLEFIAILDALVVVAAVVLPVRVFARNYSPELPVARTTALSLLVASLGSLPFYVAYLMPDIFAPVLFVTIATLTAFAGRMKWSEISFAFILASFAVLTHASNIAIAAVLLPSVVLFSFLIERKRRLVAPIIVLLLIGLGIGEQVAFRTAIKSNSGKEVSFLPHLTARLIQDEIGFDYLKDRCPDASVPTCALFDALTKSDNPMRLTASHIVFQRSPELGSYRLMSSEDQIKVAQNQVPFFFDVLGKYPVRTTYAFIKNIAAQVGLNSVDMTLQSPQIVRALGGVSGLAIGEFQEGRLTKNLIWLKPVNAAQQVLYIISFIILLFMIIWPRALNGRTRVLVAMLGLSVLANALIMGGISQPATRYGSRVVWLIPLAAMFSLFFSPLFAVLKKSSGNTEN